ncbi:MAG: hypothetical protein HWN65_13470 [Candidatus Helarchaeota archaeon]|nr:hypothetical protein [Candidatus Helarchaeota archaeon]
MKNTQKKQMICMGLILLFFLMFISAQFTFINTKTNTVGDSPISRLQGPEITNVVINPNTPEWYDNITITAQITDPEGIFEAWINYDADNDAYAGWGANFTMTHVSDDDYTYTIQNSMWDLPYGPAHGSILNFTIYAKNGVGTWSQSGYYQFYINDTVKPVAQILTLSNNSYVSGIVEINTTISEEGSGLKQANLSIYMGNGTLLERFTSTNLNETFNWDVSALPDYNVSEPASYYTINFTAWDNANPINRDTIILESIRIDNAAPYMAFIHSYKNLTASAQDNQTATTNVISATNFMNNLTETEVNDSSYHSFYNGSLGFLQMVYGFNLSSWNITSDMIITLSIAIEGKIGYANSSILEAGWKIWNWIYDNFTIIDSTVFNSTDEVFDTFDLTNLNRSLYISDDSSQRLEIFFYINTTGSAINASIDYIVYNMTYYKTDDWYNRDNENLTLQVKGFDLISFDRIELFHKNDTHYIWNSSGIHYLEFNTSVLSDGIVPLNITVYDKAGNTNSSSVFLNVDFLGPVITIISPENNSYIGQSQIWNLIVPVEISGYDAANNFERMELWIDDALAPVLPGQLGQIMEYDEFGNITYEQTNATWYEEGTYTYYWNASTLLHNTTHKLEIRSYDGFGNPNQNISYVTVATFYSNLTIIDIGAPYSTTSDVGIVLSFVLINWGNATLKDWQPDVIVPAGWEWYYHEIDMLEFHSLIPTEVKGLKIKIIPRSVQSTTNQSIKIVFNCQIFENLTQPVNNFTLVFETYVIVEPASDWEDKMAAIFILISVAAGIGIGLFSFYIYQYLKKVSTQPSKPPEKVKKRK